MQTEDGTFISDDQGRWSRIAEELTAPGVTKKDYDDLAKILRTYRNFGATPAATAGAISARLPQFPSVSAALLSDKGVAVATWIGVLLQVLFWLGSLASDAQTPQTAPAPTVIVNVQAPSTEEVRRVIEETIEEEQRKEREAAKRGHEGDEPHR